MVIRPTLDGLEIAPVIRSQWNGSNVIRHFGGFATILTSGQGPGVSTPVEN
jgi:hypothetical protein